MNARAFRCIQTVMLFLFKHKKKSDEYDWEKLKCVLKYLKVTRKLNLPLSIGYMSVVKWWVNASYKFDKDCQGHTGGMMFLGKGLVSSFSPKKINGNIYT